MRKQCFRLSALILVITIVIGIMPMTVFASEWDGLLSVEAPNGSGTQEDPYQISDAADLKWFANAVNGSNAKSTSTLCAKLISDIDLAGQEWTPIGVYNSYSDCVYYGGVFDGNGKTVSGLSIDTTKQYQALFGYVKGGTVKNLTVSGSVQTAPSSSSYAAGIVAYGYPVNIENCTNMVDVTSVTKGYVAGIAAYTSGGSKITNCTNNGTIWGCGDFVGGIVGTATGSSSAGITSIQNCFNTGSVTNNGKPSSYTYSVGGIAGGLSGNSIVSMCGNIGDITSTVKRTGGIVGSLAGSINKCFNEGNVTGIYGVGGIVGDSADKASSVTSCYNTGTVTGENPIVSFNDKNAKGVGGIIGGVSSNSYNATLKDCYNTGRVMLNTELTDVLVGGIVGNSSGKNYSGVETSGLIIASNCYYENSAAEQGDGYNPSAQGLISKTSYEMKAKGFSLILGEDYIDNSNGGYPLLGWQDPNAEYAVTFTIAPTGAILTVIGDDGEIKPSYGTTYHLKNGIYSYTVTGEECESVSGCFNVAYGGQNIDVSLKVKTYDFVFITDPIDAALTIEGQTPQADGRVYRLAKAGNPYKYKAAAFGYEPASGSVTVTGKSDEDKLTVSLKKQTLYTVTFPVVKEDGGSDSDIYIRVLSDSYPSANITPQEDGSFSLPNGTYTYTVFCQGYKSVKGSFTVDGENLTLPQAFLEIQTAWDGETITQPAKDSEGVYQITTPDELIWFQQNALLTDSARLMSDIRINEDVSAEDKSLLYKWLPIGTNGSKAYSGDFDGNGHTVSGLYISVTGSNAGMFGYVGTGGSVHDLTISDSVIVSTGNYTGAIVGDLKGTVKNSHVSDSVSISGKAYVGGIVGELDTGGSVNCCSNSGGVRGTGTASSDGYVGGIAGRVYSAASNALTDSFNTGSVMGFSSVGGIAGTVYMGGTLENVYSAGSVTATREIVGTAGGISGQFRTGTICNAYASGSVSAAKSGGVIGGLDTGTQTIVLKTVYYLNSIASDSIGNVNGRTIQGTAKSCTSAELKITAEALGDAFYENESEHNGGYPLLYWQIGQSVIDPNAPTSDPDGWNGKTSSNAPKQQDGVYQIATPAELKWFSKASQTVSDICGVLVSDINLNYQAWAPIGGSSSDTAFRGSFDGNGYKIQNMYINTDAAAGLFSYNSGDIRNLTIEGVIYGADNAAAVAAYNSGKISDVTSTVTLNGGNRVAGIAANNEINGVITDCRNDGTISGGNYTAGITSVNKGIVETSCNIGGITGNGSFVAGVVSDNNGGTVKNCANNGQIIGKAAVRYSYVSGVVGRNDGTSQNLYNSGNVVGLGSGVGGCIAVNTVNSVADGLYNAGDVCGSYIDTSDGEDFRVGGAVGEVVSGVSNAYTLDTLTITTGGILVSSEVLSEKAGNLPSMLPVKSDIDGTVSLGTLQAEDSVTADYEGNSTQPVFVWYLFDGYDETVLAISDEYKIPADLVGHKLYVKVMDSSLNGIVKGFSEKVDGFSGTVKINGYAVVGHTLQAVYTGSESAPVYRWYCGSTMINGATDSCYTVTAEDEGKILTLRVTGSKPGYIEQQTETVKTGKQAGIWPEEEMSEPQADQTGTYLITNESELKWFVSFVNGENPAANARLISNITITEDEWYPIGSSRYPYSGEFDGNGRIVSGFSIISSSDEQGFFGNIGGKGEVKNLTISGSVTVTGEDVVSAGGLAGYLEGKITDCSFSGRVSGIRDVGGIVGQAGLNSEISRCINSGRVTGNENVGGIVGSVSYGNISECANIGDIGQEKSRKTGGIAGYMTNYAVVTACYNTGHIIGYDYLGGISGLASVCAAPQGCYNVGNVDTGMHAFGVLGDLTGTDYISVVTGSYYLAESSQEATDKTAQGVNGSGMKKAAFVSLLNAQAGKSLFVMDLQEENSGYPLLLWQTGKTGDDDIGGNQPDVLNVTFVLCGDTAHGADGIHNQYTEWIEPTSCTLPNGATAYDLFKKMMSDYGLSYEVEKNSYVSSVTGPDGITLSEFANGPRSGWMYTINNRFPDYMASVKLKDGDEMRFFYTDDYKDTNWNPSDPVVIEVERLIDGIGTVTLNSADSIRTARDAYELLTDGQKLIVSNIDILEKAEKSYKQLLAEKPEKDRQAAAAVDQLIEAIGTVTISCREEITAARNAYELLTEDQKKLVTRLSYLENAEEIFKQIVSEKTASDMAAAAGVDKLIDSIDTVTVRSRTDIEKARAAYNGLTDDQKIYVTNKPLLQQAETVLQKLLSEQQALREDICKITGDRLLAGNIPTVSSIGGEWVVLGLSRADRISDEFKIGYYNNLVKVLRETSSEKLHRSKSTENSRVVIALTSLGYDAADIDGYNLLLPLADVDYLQKQGVNGSIWALIAFDTANYAIPTVENGKTQTTREGLIRTILSEQTEWGGWSLDGGIGDVDLTAMALQALAPYSESHPEVKNAVFRALNFLSERQRSDGSFASFGNSSSESCAQVVVALTSLGIDPDNDSRFIKNGRSVIDALIAFYRNGGFRHTMDGEVSSMATEQGYYAMVSYFRFINGKTSLYDMSDISIKKAEQDLRPSQIDDSNNQGNQAFEAENNDIKNSQTEDNMNISLYIWLTMTAIAGMSVTVLHRRNNKQRKD